MVFATTTTTTTITTSREVAFFSLSLSLSRRRRRRRLLRPPGEVATISFFVGGQNCEKFNHQTKWRLFFFFIPFAFIQTHYTHTHPQRADVRREYPLADRSLSLSLYIYIWCVVVSLLSLFLFLEIKNFPLSLCSCCCVVSKRRRRRRRPTTRFHRVTADINSFSLLLCFLCLRYKQARKGIHPLLRRVQYVGTNGQTYQLWSTVKHHQDRFFLSQDQYTHPAWTGIPPKSAATGQAAKFKRRGFDFLSGLKGRTTNQQQQGAKKQPTKK